METSSKSHNRGLISLLFIFALLVSIYPLPLEYRWYRPELLTLLLIYWVLAMPQQFGPLLWFGVGLVQDVVTGSMLGQHAVGTVIIGYLCVLSYQRIRNYSLWQQACWVFVVCGIAGLLYQWTNSLRGVSSAGLMFLTPVLISALSWPLFVFVLDQVRKRFRIR